MIRKGDWLEDDWKLEKYPGVICFLMNDPSDPPSGSTTYGELFLDLTMEFLASLNSPSSVLHVNISSVLLLIKFRLEAR